MKHKNDKNKFNGVLLRILLNLFLSFLCFSRFFLLTHTPHITAVEAGRSSRRDEGPGLDLGGVFFFDKKGPPFF